MQGLVNGLKESIQELKVDCIRAACAVVALLAYAYYAYDVPKGFGGMQGPASTLHRWAPGNTY